MSLRLQLLQVARLAPRLLGDSTGLVRDFFQRQAEFDAAGVETISQEIAHHRILRNQNTYMIIRRNPLLSSPTAALGRTPLPGPLRLHHRPQRQGPVQRLHDHGRYFRHVGPDRQPGLRAGHPAGAPDGLDHVEEVRGAGVVGQQPVLEPGQSFKYSSWCPLKTPTGMMQGTYEMVREDGSRFEIEVAPFALRARYTVH